MTTYKLLISTTLFMACLILQSCSGRPRHAEAGNDVQAETSSTKKSQNALKTDTPIIELNRDVSIVDVKKIYEENRNGNPQDLCEKAHTLIVDGKADNAMVLLKTSCAVNSMSSKEDEETMSRALFRMGYLYYYHYNDIVQSHANFMMSLDIAQQANLSNLYPIIYNNLAAIFLMIGDVPSAVDNYSKSFENAVRMGDDHWVGAAFSEMITHSIGA